MYNLRSQQQAATAANNAVVMAAQQQEINNVLLEDDDDSDSISSLEDQSVVNILNPLNVEVDHFDSRTVNSFTD